MIFLKKIELSNFLSHSDTTLEIKPEQKLLIDGISGSGKSSVVEGLVWCLYGKARAANRALIKSGTTTASVTVILEDDDKSYRIVRSINTKGKHELEVFEKEPKAKTFKPSKVSGIKNLQDYLERQVLKSSYLLFINSIVYPQENVESFVRQPAAKRKDLILEIINAADYDDYLTKAKDTLAEKRLFKEVAATRIDEKTTLLASYVETAAKLKEYQDVDELKKTHLSVLEEKIKEENDKLNEIKVRSMVQKDKMKRLEELTKELDELIEKENGLNLKIGELKSLNISEVRAKVSKLPMAKTELDNLYQKVTDFNTWNSKMMVIIKETPSSIDYDAQIDRFNKQIIEVMQENLDLCPELNKVCPILSDKRQIRIAQMDSEVKRLKKEKEDDAILKREHESKILSVGTAPILPETSAIEALKAEIADLEASSLKLREYEVKIGLVAPMEEELKALNDKIATATDELGKLTVEMGGFDGLTSQENHIVEFIGSLIMQRGGVIMEINDNTANLTQALEAERKVDKYRVEIEELKKSQEVISNEMEALESIKEALGPNGIRAIVIDLIIPQLEDKINNILGKLSEFRVKLETQKSGVGDKTVLEGLFINIINDQGEEFDFENYSGGERLKIVVAISEALSEVQKIGFRILDELFIGLDEESTEKFAEVMTSLQEKFKQMVCISHLRGIKDLFDERVTVTKINGTSKLTK